MKYQQIIFIKLLFSSTIVLALRRELIPQEAPGNLTLNKIIAHQVEVQWDPVSSESIRGTFRGYLVRIWNHIGSQVFAYPAGAIRATIDFFPYSKNFVTVAARNERYVGAPSNAVSFDAPQIVPNHPYIFEAFVLSNQSVLLKWNRPTEPNGILLGYKIYYGENASHGINNEIVHDINDPEKFQAKLTHLKEGVNYKISISALNCAGESERYSIDVQLGKHLPTQPYPPDFIYKINYRPIDKLELCSRMPEAPMPTLPSTTEHFQDDYDYYDYTLMNDSRKLGDDRHGSINDRRNLTPEEEKRFCLGNCLIMWLPDIDNIPGEYFYVRYRIRGDEIYITTEPEKKNDYIILNEFNTCRNYEIILTSVDGEFSTDSRMKVTPTKI